MPKKNISALVARYENMLHSGRSVYFDSDEFEEIADFYDVQENSDAVEAVVEEGLKQHPGHAGLLIKKAKLLILKKKYNEALSLVDSLSEMNDTEALLLKAEIFLHTDTIQSALSIFDIYIEQVENEFDVLDVADILKSVNLLQDCIFYLEKGVEKFPSGIDIYRELADCYRSLNNFDQAILIYDKILDIDPYSIEDWIDLGELYNLKNDYAKAIEAFDFSLAIDEFDERALFLKGNTLILNENMEKAVETLLEYIELNPQDDTTLVLIAECYSEMGDYENAKFYTLKAVDLNPESIIGLKKLVYLFLDKDYFTEALFYLERTIVLSPDESNLFFLRADILNSLERYDEAWADYEKALSITTNEDEKIDIIYSLGNLMLKIDKDDNALMYFEWTESLRPDYPDIFLKMAFSYYRTEQYDNAIVYLKKAENESTDELLPNEIEERNTLIRKLNIVLTNDELN